MMSRDEDPAFGAAVDAMLDRSRGWRFGGIHRRRRNAAAWDDQSVAVHRLLDELSVELGFDLPPRQLARLRRSAYHDADDLTGALFGTLGLDVRLFPHLRRQVMQRVADHLG